MCDCYSVFRVVSKVGLVAYVVVLHSGQGKKRMGMNSLKCGCKFALLANTVDGQKGLLEIATFHPNYTLPCNPCPEQLLVGLRRSGCELGEVCVVTVNVCSIDTA